VAEQLFDKVRPWFEKAFAEHDDVPGLAWELSFAHLPNPAAKDGEARMTSVLVLYVQAPTGNDLQHLVNTILLSAGFDEAYALNTVRDYVGSMRRKLAELSQGFAIPEGDLRRAGLAP
jgi:hypothetical protein